MTGRLGDRRSEHSESRSYSARIVKRRINPTSLRTLAKITRE
jgi:hypothetical protein